MRTRTAAVSAFLKTDGAARPRRVGVEAEYGDPFAGELPAAIDGPRVPEGPMRARNMNYT